VHYTDGIPGIHDGKRNAAFADEYMVMAERAMMDTAQ
jgi:prepilin-type processing-associated H-X9-DG protein